MLLMLSMYCLKEFVQILLISMSWFVVDSDLMMSVPSKFTAYQDMDAFFHASETVVNINHHPMAEMFALKTIEYVAEYLPRAEKTEMTKKHVHIWLLPTHLQVII